MTPADYFEPATAPTSPRSPSTVPVAPTPLHGGSLRGAPAVSVGGQLWRVVGGVALVIFAAITIISFLSAANDNARIDRLKTHGISTIVTVDNCVGNLGGSGSNIVNYTCSGDYRVAGVAYREVIVGQLNYLAPGTLVRAIVDPSHPGSVELRSVLARSSTSSSVYVAPSILALVLIVLVAGYVRLLRRKRLVEHESIDSSTATPAT